MRKMDSNTYIDIILYQMFYSKSPIVKLARMGRRGAACQITMVTAYGWWVTWHKALLSFEAYFFGKAYIFADERL